MRLQIGKKKIEEIERLIDENCWKALFWIHSLILIQLKYLLYYKKQAKKLGRWNVNLIPDKHGLVSKTIKLNGLDEHKKKWKKLCDGFRYLGPLTETCFSLSLIDKEYEDIKKFNNFRNKKMGHATVDEYLPQDSEVKRMCKLGLKVVGMLDKKITNCLK